MVWQGTAGWAEWSPFLDYSGPELLSWLRAADEAAEQGWPEPVRDEVAVNSTIPAVAPEQAYALARSAGCRTAKVKVAQAGQSLAEDLARVAAVRDAVGADGRIRVDARAWSWRRRSPRSRRWPGSGSSTSSSPHDGRGLATPGSLARAGVDGDGRMPTRDPPGRGPVRGRPVRGGRRRGVQVQPSAESGTHGVAERSG